MHRTHRARLAATGLFAAALIISPTACGNVKDQLLEPQNPGIVDPSSVNSPDAADALRIGALGYLRTVTAGSESLWLYGGLLTDEWKSADTFLQRNETDQRAIQTNNANINTAYQNIQRSRGYIRDAIEQMVKYLPDSSANRGELFFALGFVEMQMGEDFCNGIPLGLARGGIIDYSDPSYTPLTDAAVLARALAHVDSGLALITAQTSTRATSLKQAALVAKARILVDQGQIAQAAALVPTSAVPTNYQYLLTFLQTTGDNNLWSFNTSQGRYTVADSFDASGVIKNALPFVSAKDSRVPIADPKKKGFDGQTNLINYSIARSDPTPLVSGIDARLIEAEGKLAVDDIAGAMTILNALRGSAQTMGSIKTTVMAPLATPATKDDAVTLFFREKAFWTFARGQRLGDERRLVRQYGRPQDQVFPVGSFFKNGVYGIDVNLPVTDTEKTNPKFTGCIDRSA
jgi:hypothetical protein